LSLHCVLCIQCCICRDIYNIEYTRHSIKTISKRSRQPKRKPIMNNPETHTPLNTQDTACLVYSMLYMSLDCPLLVSSTVVSNVYLLSVYCVLCIQCCICLWIVHYWFPLRLSLTFTYCLYTVSCVFNVVYVSGLSPKRKPIMDNPETHTTLKIQDTV
jgi:hypothetical protein